MFSSSKIKLIRCLNILKLSAMFSPTEFIVGYLAIVYGNSRRRLRVSNYVSVVMGVCYKPATVFTSAHGTNTLFSAS